MPTPAAALGLVVNPVAGMGGRVGLHGTDGPNLALALERGAQPVAGHRARVALQRLSRLAPTLTVRTTAGPMGGDHLPAASWQVVAAEAPAGKTAAADTRDAVAHLVEAGVALVLFVGGDGTARDVVAVTGPGFPVLGVPAGVKMHSSVFATGPAAAGTIAARYLLAPELVGTRVGEVLDRDGDGVRIHAVARVPAAAGALQRAKAGPYPDDEADLAALGREVAAEVPTETLCLLGPGTSTAHVAAAWGVPASPLGVDVVLDGRPLLIDATEDQLLDLLASRPSTRLVLGVIGGQGFLLGRGNQQLSPAVLAAIGLENVDVLCGVSKIMALDEPVLRVDLDDPALTDRLTGYRRVRTAPGRSTVLRVAAAEPAELVAPPKLVPPEPSPGGPTDSAPINPSAA